VNSLLMKVIYIWKCFPDCILKIFKVFLPWAPEGLEHYPFRSAEKAFEPWEVPVCGNYADQIVTPTICFCFLFFASPYTHKVFFGMLTWSAFEYIFFRYMHLRYHKSCTYTTSRLDTFSNFLWGVPLSVIASACSQWGFRAGVIGHGLRLYQKTLCNCGVFMASLILWVAAYHFLVDPFGVEETADKDQDMTVEELSAETVYTWFNVNTPFALKCKYYWKDKEGKDIESRRKGHPIACGVDENQVRFFEVGKEGLFLPPDRYKLVHKLPPDFMEFETWFEALLRIMDRVARACNCKTDRSSSGREVTTRSEEELEIGLLGDSTAVSSGGLRE